MVIAPVFARHLDRGSERVLKIRLFESDWKTRRLFHLGFVAPYTFERFGVATLR